MNQLTQQLKSGHMEILEVPFPIPGENQVLVRNLFSVISAGTEGKTVSDARKGYVAKARSRQKEVKQVLEMIRTNGLVDTYKLVMNKLEAPAALGYSCAGEVLAVGSGITRFRPGDRVACGGASAVHAEVVAVPENLCVQVPPEVDLQQAAFTTIAAIAIQGIRQSSLKMGEHALVIGMGLIGQLTALILEASGVHVTGIDIDPAQLQAAGKAGITNLYPRNQEGLQDILLRASRGYGMDAVIITAGTSSLDPVEFAGEVARKKGKVVIVGAVPTGFSRTHYYKKELDLRMSSSYGPGRYDSAYEEKGLDYPVGYVRWTENRNMESFIDLLSHRKISISPLITHVFPLAEAPDAYSMILEKSEPFTGVLIRYDELAELKRDLEFHPAKPLSATPRVGFIGAGSFAQNMLLPNLKGLCEFTGVATAHGNTSAYVGKKYGFAYASSDPQRILQDEQVNTVFIATRHHLHAGYVQEALKAGKHVFVEKPLAMNPEELAAIESCYSTRPQNLLMVGYNRRFSPAVKAMEGQLHPEQPRAISMRINAGTMPPDHWVNDPQTGGGRIIGEACHFIDLALFLAGAEITQVYATACKDVYKLDNTVSINLRFSNGSIAAIQYFSNGNKLVPKEQLELFCDGSIARIDDFRTLSLTGKKKKFYRFRGQDKGHKGELLAFTRAVKQGLPAPIPFSELVNGMKATFAVLESIKSGQPVKLM